MLNEDQEERRRSHQHLVQLIEGLVETLHKHMNEEEADIKRMHEAIDRFFNELDAHTHLHHHDYVSNKIEQEEESNKWWSDLKKDVMKYVLVALFTASLSWVGHNMYEDLAHHSATHIPTAEQGAK